MTLRDHLQKHPFTLTFSSGFFGFFAHQGFSLAIKEAGLKPQRVTGSSAGAILAGAWACDVPLDEMKSVLIELKRERFWDPTPGLGFLRGKRMEDFLREIFQGQNPVLPYSISTFDILRRRTKSFNQGDLPRLIRASCAVPMMFHPVLINRRLYWDGGILDKAGTDSVQPNEKVLVHFLPSHGVHRVYQSRRAQKTIESKHFVMSPPNLPLVGPNRLDQGMRAIDVAYEHAVKALTAPFESSLGL